jgi:hypothetical protein
VLAGIFNSRQNHVWAEGNPLAAFIYCQEQSFSFNVWAGIAHDLVTGPYLLSLQLIAQIYWLFSEEALPEFLEEFPLSLGRNMCFQHGGAAPHFARQGQEYLTATYKNPWIGRGGPVA